jgi:uncharacterized protein involved in exopolysaccharide biosynthesis
LYVLSHTDSDPQLAARVVQALLNIFMESQLGTKRRDFAEAQSFINRQIADYERNLQTAEQRLAQFRQDNIDILPAAGSFASQASAAAQRRDQLQSDLADARVRRENLQSQLAETPPTVQLSSAQAAAAGGRYSGRIGELQQQIDQLRLRYTDEHPDIVALRRQIQLLRSQGTNERRAIDAQTPRDTPAREPRRESATPRDGPAPREATAPREGTQRDAAGTGRGGTTVPNTVYEQIRLRLADEETNVATLHRRLTDAEGEVERLHGLASRVPQVEAELANLNRDYNVIKTNYEALLARRESARIAQAADERTDALRFRIIDPPRVPTIPSAPNRTLLFAVVLVAGLAVGVVATALMAQLNESFWTPAQLREFFQFPVLGSVSYLSTIRQRRAHVAGNLAFVSLCLSLLGVGAILALFGPRLPGMVQNIVTTIVDRWTLQV